MRQVWRAEAASQPFVVAGSGTLAMEMAAANLVAPGDQALVVKTGYFSDRMVEILRRYGARVTEVGAEVGDAPAVEQVARVLEGGGPWQALFATHVDTSTAVRIDPQPLARLATEHGALSVFDGVCATAGERFEMGAWGADLYFTASQKAIGLPPGLALMVASGRALAARQARTAPPPPLYLDWLSWLPIHRAYEEGKPSYFATPATSLVMALEAGLAEILAEGVEARWHAHQRTADAMRRAWAALGLAPVPLLGLAANTLSALTLPTGLKPADVVPKIAAQGVLVAGGLHPAIRDTYIRVGHMGVVVHRPTDLERTVRAVAAGIDGDTESAIAQLRQTL
jgi:alanine-glyoxylate transaminase/serine-glyoxylate transaminase/serine-pyruvate transaminase